MDIFTIDIYYRRHGAGSHAINHLQAEHTIAGGLTRLYLQLPLQLLDDAHGGIYMTGSAMADLNMVFTGCLKPELVVKSKPHHISCWWATL